MIILGEIPAICIIPVLNFVQINTISVSKQPMHSLILELSSYFAHQIHNDTHCEASKPHLTIEFEKSN